MTTVPCLDKVVRYQPVGSCDVTMTTTRQALGMLNQLTIQKALGALPQNLFSDNELLFVCF